MQIVVKDQGFWETVGEQSLYSGVIVGGAAISPIGKVVTFATGGSAAALIGITAIAGTAGYAGYTQYQNQLLAGLYCGEFTSSEQAKKGCSEVASRPKEKYQG